MQLHLKIFLVANIYYCSKVLGQYVFFHEINTFVHQVCIKLIKSDSEDIYTVKNIYISNKCCWFQL